MTTITITMEMLDNAFDRLIEKELRPWYEIYDNDGFMLKMCKELGIDEETLKNDETFMKWEAFVEWDSDMIDDL